MEPTKCSSVVHGSESDSTSSMVNSLSKAFQQIQFRESFKKINAKPSWYNSNDCSTRQKNLIDKLQRAEERFHAIIATADNSLNADWNQSHEIYSRIKDIFVELLRHEMKFCRQHNVEQHFWKILYYNLIENARRLIHNQNSSDVNRTYRQLCQNLVNDGVQLFERILLLLAETYGFQLEQFIDVNSGRNLRGLKYVSLAIVSTQKCCMYLGDLHRYRELVNESTQFSEAAQCYTKAYQLIPSNGMPSNQLAIIALYNKKKFNAIFYHMRSLNASNPIKSAKESLVILFDELRKKYQSINLIARSNQDNDDDANKQLMQKNQIKKQKTNFKREIWVHPTDGQLNYRTVYLDQENEDETLRDSADLYKKFMFDFSHLHGILFTKVDSDSLEICMEQTLKQFQVLLNHSSCVFTMQKMIQMIILNIYSIENSMQLSSLSHDALAFSFTFIGIILNKLQYDLENMLSTTTTAATNASDSAINTDNTNTLFEPQKHHVTTNNVGETHFSVGQINIFKLSDSINNSLAAISFWCNWLKFNWIVWTSDSMLGFINKFSEAFGIFVWDDFARLTMALDRFNFQIDQQLLIRTEPLQQQQQQYSLYKRIRLAEDMMALGMSSVIRDDFVYCHNDVDVYNASTILRWKNIHRFCTIELMKENCSFLCRLDFGEIVATQQCNSFDVDNSHHNNDSVQSIEFNSSNNILENVALNKSNHHEQQPPDCQIDNNLGASMTPSSNDLHEILTENQSNNDTEPTASTSTNEIQKLLQRKIELEHSEKLQEKQRKFRQDILHQTSSQTISLEIRPKYLLPDTNCFIDFLSQIKQLTQVYPLYHVIVPIVVLNELEGLAKGDENGLKIYDTPTKTSLNAHKALVYLKSTGSNIKCATTKGSFLNSMAFTKESDYVTSMDGNVAVEPLNNDDKILLTAINLTKLHSNDCISNSKLISISNLQRKVVLLTNDRNLKLKAITQNIPVRELIDFIKWSGIAN